MAEIRAMAVFQGGSNLPEDRYVNTFHFLSPSSYASDAGLIATAVDNFYSATYASNTVGGFLSPYVSRTYSIRTYDMADATPRVPTITSQNIAVPSTGGPAASIPEEAALCLSYHTIPPVTARRRGRIYIGPLCAAALTPGDPATPTRASTAIVNCLKGAANALVLAGLGWSVYSPTADTYGVIVGGWVDDAFDTQRRRGADSTFRNIWTS